MTDATISPARQGGMALPKVKVGAVVMTLYDFSLNFGGFWSFADTRPDFREFTVVYDEGEEYDRDDEPTDIVEVRDELPETGYETERLAVGVPSAGV